LHVVGVKTPPLGASVNITEPVGVLGTLEVTMTLHPAFWPVSTGDGHVIDVAVETSPGVTFRSKLAWLDAYKGVLLKLAVIECVPVPASEGEYATEQVPA